MIQDDVCLFMDTVRSIHMQDMYDIWTLTVFNNLIKKQIRLPNLISLTRGNGLTELYVLR